MIGGYSGKMETRHISWLSEDYILISFICFEIKKPKKWGKEACL